MHLYNITLMLNRAAESRRLTSNTHAGVVRNVMDAIARKHATVYVWLVMPDHIHVLFSRTEPLKDVEAFAGRIKHRINQALKQKGMHELKWRDGCVSHPASWESLKAVRNYILANPVRGQLVKSEEDWRHKDTPAPIPE